MKNLYERIDEIDRDEAQIKRVRAFRGDYCAVIIIDDGGNQEEAACTHSELMRFLRVIEKRIARRKRMLKKIIALRYLRRP